MAHLPLIETDENLLQVLHSAKTEDLGILVGYIHRTHSEDLSSVPDFQKENPNAEKNIYDGDHRIYADEIAAEIQRFGGNSVINAFRGGKGVTYDEIVRDVADKLKVKYNKKSDIEIIEQEIQIKIMEGAYKKMSDHEKKEFLKSINVSSTRIPSAFPIAAIQAAAALGGRYGLSTILANAVAKQLLGRGLALVGNTALTRSISIIMGPVGWAITALWTAFDLAGPAYRVTIPCVLQIAYIRQKNQAEFLMINDCLSSNFNEK